MCGDFDEQERLDEELFDAFLEQAGTFDIVPQPPEGDAVVKLDTEKNRADYMEQLFTAGLSRCANDAASLPYGQRMDALAGQAIVFARLAGFLAAQFPREADRFRTVITAVVDAHEAPQAR